MRVCVIVFMLTMLLAFSQKKDWTSDRLESKCFVSSSVTITMNPSYPSQFRDVMVNRCTQAGLVLRNTYRQLLNVPYPPASVPGEYPRRRTGKLRDGVLLEVHGVPGKDVFATVTSTVPYTMPLINRRRLHLMHAMQSCQMQIERIMRG